MNVSVTYYIILLLFFFIFSLSSPLSAGLMEEKSTNSFTSVRQTAADNSANSKIEEIEDPGGTVPQNRTQNKEETECLNSDTYLVITPDVVEEKYVQIDTGMYYSIFKDGSPSEHSFYFALRTPTGNGTELKVSCNFLKYVHPDLGMDDIYLGLKWQFRKTNPAMALNATLRLPSGTEVFSSETSARPYSGL